MNVITVTTKADPRRVGLTYKIELPDWAFEAWYTNNVELEKAHRRVVNHPYEKPSTGIIIIKSDGTLVAKAYDLSFEDLQDLLAQADNTIHPYEEVRGPGRPEKRVLVLTTSKERRTGSLVARPTY